MSRRRGFVQLLRLPALPTALADVGLGTLAAWSASGGWPAVRWLSCLLAGLATACLYSGGMVLNDFFDVEQDRRERPTRPIPSGLVSRHEAGVFGACLLGAGMLAATLASCVLSLDRTAQHPTAPLALAAALVAAILLYDGRMKRTGAGPVGMGMCRFLNVLLAASAGGVALGAQALYLAAVVGLYVAGVTWLARTEALTSRPSALLAAAGVMLAGLVLALPLPELRLPGQRTSSLFVYLLVALGLGLGWVASRAVDRPTPARVQSAVRSALLGLIVLDAALATALAGWAGLLLLVLLAPSLYLSGVRGLYAT
jgi:4-hydroxybenzoate polyprenyltransferase